MDYTTKLAYQSNYWYNDGLNKANIRDLTVAITSLKKSLQYNRDNIASRNLLGLVCMDERRCGTEALAEWVLTRVWPKRYCELLYQKVKEKEMIWTESIRLKDIGNSYCYQRCEDLAVMQQESNRDASDVCESLHTNYSTPLHYGRTVCRSEDIRIALGTWIRPTISRCVMHELNQVRKSRNIRLMN